MNVDPAKAAAQFQYSGKTYYFCCKGCAARFEKEPQKYLAPLGGPGMAAPIQIAMHSQQSHGAHTTTIPASAALGAAAVPEKFQSETASGKRAAETDVRYTCPMHPEIVQGGPGSCPKCGMALEPMDVFAEVEADPEYDSMRRRFWVSAALSLPVLILAMFGDALRMPVSAAVRNWMELILATPVVLWGGWPFFERGWASIVNRSPNMFTLIAIGTGAAYGYSIVATVFPDIFPASFRGHGGEVAVYFEAAAVITTLVLLGQVLELRARSQTSSAIRILLRLAPKTARIIQTN